MVNRSDTYNSGYFSSIYGEYTDTPRIWVLLDALLELKPESVLELGCATGPLIKHLEDINIKSKGLEVSKFCYLNRVTESIVTWDLVDIPWPIKDKEFDVCFSNEVLECIPVEHIDAVLNEINRVSKRGLHRVFTTDIKKDKVKHLHEDFRNIVQSLEWWKTRAANFNTQQIASSEMYFEKFHIKSLSWNSGPTKINLGSWVKMFHHGWINVDTANVKEFADAYGFKFQQLDVLKNKARSNSATAIVAMHLLNHLTYEQGNELLAISWESLMPGGIIRIGVPDTAKLIKMYHNGELSRFNELNDDIKLCHNTDKLFHLLAGHKSLHDINTLVNMLRNAGFTKIEQVPFRASRSKHIQTETMDSLPDLSLYVEANKFVL